MHVLIVEDDPETTSHIRQALQESEGDTIVTVIGWSRDDQGKIVGQAASDDYDVILMDINAPSPESEPACQTEYDTIRAIHLKRRDTPILVVSNLAGIEHKVTALGRGIGDYVTKPFDHNDLALRIQKLAARHPRRNTPQIVEIGDLTVDFNTQAVHVAGRKLHLTGKEYQLLELMAERQGEPVTAQMIIDRLYPDGDAELKLADTFIAKTRKKLSNASGGRNYIETVWGQGYKMRIPQPGDAPLPA